MKNLYLNKVLKKFIFLNWFLGAKGEFVFASVIKVLAFTLILPLFVIIGSYFDGTFYLSGDGRGLLEHYGVWAFFLTTPVLLVLTLYILSKFVNLINNIKDYTLEKRIPRGLKVVINRCINSLSLNSKTKYILILFMIVGFFFSIVNIMQTLDPKKTFGNDVFDAYPYIGGYITNKMFLGFLWTVIYPIIFYVILHVTFSMILIMRYMYNKKILHVDFFNKDNCAGITQLGVINTLIMLIYLNYSKILFWLFYTHKNNDYLTILLPAIGFTVLMFVQNFAGVYYIQKFVKSEKNKYLEKISNKLREELKQYKNNDFLGQFPEELLALRNHIISVKPYPYTRIVTVILNFAVSFFPTAMSLAKIIF